MNKAHGNDMVRLDLYGLRSVSFCAVNTRQLTGRQKTSVNRSRKNPWRLEMILTPNKCVVANANRWVLTILIALAFLLGANSALAQQITGAIGGTVTDAEGAVVPNAS